MRAQKKQDRIEIGRLDRRGEPVGREPSDGCARARMQRAPHGIGCGDASVNALRG